jgi:hypothetical protein
MRPARVDAVASPESSEVVRNVGLDERDRVSELSKRVEEVEVRPVAVPVLLRDVDRGLKGCGCDTDLDGLSEPSDALMTPI